MSKIPSDEILDRMESVLNIASDFTRLKIMYAIMKEEKSVSEIVEEVGASQSLVSHQLSVLKNDDLVSTRKDGTKVFYRLADEHVDMLLKIVYEPVSEKE